MRSKVLLICALSFCTALTCGAVRADGVIPVVNASFESHNAFTNGCGTGCLFNVAQIPGWTVTGVGGSFQPNSSQFILPLPDGNVVAFSNGGTISQDLGVSVQGNSTYTLSVDVGHRLDGLVTNYSIALLDGSTSLCATPTASNGSFAAGTFLDVILTCTTGFAVDPGDLSIVLTAGGGQIQFDNVSLSVATPEPSAVLLMVVGLGFVALMWRYSGRKDALQRGVC